MFEGKLREKVSRVEALGNSEKQHKNYKTVSLQKLLKQKPKNVIGAILNVSSNKGGRNPSTKTWHTGLST